LLSDEAAFSAEYWDLRPDLLEKLAVAFLLLGREASGFAFEALWAGDRIESESRASLRDFVRDVRANRVRNAHRYLVGRA
jgi:hypothetical protein